MEFRENIIGVRRKVFPVYFGAFSRRPFVNSQQIDDFFVSRTFRRFRNNGETGKIASRFSLDREKKATFFPKRMRIYKVDDVNQNLPENLNRSEINYIARWKIRLVNLFFQFRLFSNGFAARYGYVFFLQFSYSVRFVFIFCIRAC